MKRTTGSETESEEQSEEQGSTMAAPEAASKRDVQEAERKADEATTRVETLERRVDVLEDEKQKLQEENEELRSVVAKVDRLVNVVFKKGATRDDEDPLNPEMPHMAPENRDDDDDGAIPIPFGVGENDG
jgi:chromosome segregation ATPase